MATKAKLRGAFNSLVDTLTFRFDPMFPQDVAARWLGVMAYASAIGQRQAGWSALPPSLPDYDPVIETLRNATDALAAADTRYERLGALDEAEAALDDLNALLDVADTESGEDPHAPRP